MNVNHSHEIIPMTHASRIIRLSSELAEKIAAGEVIERPLSVVKELVENSLDASATRLEISIEEGGRRLIRVEDNGIGMTPEEMHLALERHATSKIKSLEDLFSISTLGFRGEALPSIASISRFTLRSRPQYPEFETGYEIHIEAGTLHQDQPVGHPMGTTMEVCDLFYNTPVRLKFLKSNETEWGHIETYLTSMALAFPDVQFIARHQGKEKLSYTHRGIENRMTEVFGKDFSEFFYSIEAAQGPISLKGYLAHPNYSRSNSDQLYLFLNQRSIRDRVLIHAIMTGYRNLLMKDQYPVGVFFITLDPSCVDVNVHPTKREVRFVNPNFIHQFLCDAIRKRLAQTPWAKTPSFSPSSEEWKFPEKSPSPPISIEANKTWFSDHYLPTKTSSLTQRVGRLPFSTLWVIGQLKGTYILCQSEGHLVLIDQHAAHERIGFERLRKAYQQQGPLLSQHLLVPQALELKEHEWEILIPHLSVFERVGLLLEEFGPTTLLVKGTPAILGSVNVEPLIHQLIQDLDSHGASYRLEDRIEEVFALMACHRQIRAGDTLTLPEMQALIQDLDEGASSYHCPHGRPVMVQISYQEIEKWFKRVL